MYFKIKAKPDYINNIVVDQIDSYLPEKMAMGRLNVGLPWLSVEIDGLVAMRELLFLGLLIAIVEGDILKRF